MAKLNLWKLFNYIIQWTRASNNRIINVNQMILLSNMKTGSKIFHYHVIDMPDTSVKQQFSYFWYCKIWFDLCYRNLKTTSNIYNIYFFFFTLLTILISYLHLHLHCTTHTYTI